MKTYRYILSLDDATPTIVTPIIDDSQVFDYEKEAEQVFLRKKLGGSALMFCNQDFDVINDAPFETKFTIDKALLNEYGSYEVVFIGIFYKTDCEFDEDRSIVTVQPEPHDEYKAVIEGLDREFNLIDLAPPIVELDYKLQPLFQVYIPGSDYITNVLSGNFFIQNTLLSTESGTELLFDYFFAPIGIFGTVLLPDTGLSPDVSGEYVDEQGLVWEDPGFSDPTKGFIRKDGVYRVRLENLFDADSDMIIEEVATGNIVYRGAKTAGQDYDTVEYVSLSTGDTTKFIFRTFWCRFLTNQTEVNSVATEDIPESDIISPQSQYNKVIRFGKLGTDPTYGSVYEDTILVSGDHSEEADKWGKFDSTVDFFAGDYFNRPTGNGTGAIYPLDRENWAQASFWWQYDTVLREFQESGAETKTQYNAYKLSDVLQSLLTALDTSLTYEENAAHSQFFYDDNLIRTTEATPVIVPKSNIIVGEYSEPAKKAPIKLSDVLALLWGAYKCKWHIEDGKFRVEHIEYYHKGMSYEFDNIGSDLTEILEGKTGKPWSYKTNKWKYDKTDIPGQIRFSWMDNASEVFDGFPIENRSAFADQGNIEEVTITIFTSDIDYIQLAPDNVTKDGFFFGEAVTEDDRLTLPFVTLNVGNTGEYKVQNGYASMLYLHDQYHKYVMPSSDMTVNLEDITAYSVKRTKLQEFTSDLGLPSDVVTEGNIMKLVRTNLGVGLIRSMSDHTNGGGSELVIEHDI